MYLLFAPKKFNKDEIPQEIFDTFEKLGAPLHERDALLGIEKDPNIIPVAFDAVFDSVSVATTFQKGTRQTRYNILQYK